LLISSRVAQIKDLILFKRQEMAKSYLRSKKLLEELLTTRLKSLETIQTILLKLDAAAGDIEASDTDPVRLLARNLRNPLR
jgi:charged multivesicular body protein 7